NPAYTTRAVIITEIMAPIMMIERYPGPSATIRIGPSATLGIALSMTKYGSDIFAVFSDNQRTVAMPIPSIVTMKNPISVSPNVMHTCFNKESSINFSDIKLITLLIEIKNKYLMQLKLFFYYI